MDLKTVTFAFLDDKKYNLFMNWWEDGGGKSIYRDFQEFQKQSSEIDYFKDDKFGDIVIFSDKPKEEDLVDLELDLEDETIKFLEAKAKDEDISIDELVTKILQQFLVKSALENKKDE